MDQTSSAQSGGSRPEVLANVSETQIDELERQFNEGDHGEWTRITGSYGWTGEQSQAVWNWFGQRPLGGKGNAGGQGSASGSYAGGETH